MSASSLASQFALGVQTNQTTVATLHQSALATQSGLSPEFDFFEPPPEHPGPAARSTARKTAPERVGFTVPVNCTFLLHPRFIGMALLAMGFVKTATVASNPAGYFTHTFKLANDAAMHWMTALHRYEGATTLLRRASQVRGEQLQINVDTQQIECQFTGRGLQEATPSGTPSIAAESPVLISPYTGSMVLEIDGGAIATDLRGNQFQITQTLDTDDRKLHTPGRLGLPRTEIDITGTLQGIPVDMGAYVHYLEIVRRNGTNPSLESPTGELTWTFASNTNIDATSTPYSITIALAEVAYAMVAPNANQRDIIRADITYQMLDTSTDPIVITLVNDVANYAAT